LPHELSGGMKQRVMIAMALACKPKLLIADEPTTALDVTIQAQVLKLMSDLQKETGMAILLITHDMGIVNQIADDICIMYAGRMAEKGSRDSIFKNMAHPYTRHLMNSIPKIKDTGFLLNTIPGIVSAATDYGAGCLFAERCSQAMDICQKIDSPQYTIEPNHYTFCHLYEHGNLPNEIARTDRIKSPERLVENKSILSIKTLRTWFPIRKGVFLRIDNYIKAVDNVDLEIQKGSTLALVGSSSTRNLGSRINARAIAMRCLCPPENSCGYLLIEDFGNPTSFKTSSVFFLRSIKPMFLECTCSPSPMISSTVIRGDNDPIGS